MDRLLLKRNTKILASISKKVKMLIHHVFIHSSIFFNWSLPSLLNRTKGQLKFPARGEELVLERVVEVIVSAKQQIRIITQTVSVADVPAMKWLNVRQPDKNNWTSGSPIFFPYFSSKSKKIYTKIFCLYLQSSSASRQPKISNLMFPANPVYRVRNHPSAWHRNFSMTRLDTVLK